MSLFVVGVTIPVLKDDYENDLGGHLAEESVDVSPFPRPWELIRVVNLRKVWAHPLGGEHQGKEKVTVGTPG